MPPVTPLAFEPEGGIDAPNLAGLPGPPDGPSRARHGCHKEAPARLGTLSQRVWTGGIA